MVHSPFRCSFESVTYHLLTGGAYKI